MIDVTDDGPGPGIGLASGPERVGLGNTRERLDALYGGRSRLDLTPEPGGAARLSLRIPFRRMAGQPAPQVGDIVIMGYFGYAVGSLGAFLTVQRLVVLLGGHGEVSRTADRGAVDDGARGRVPLGPSRFRTRGPGRGRRFRDRPGASDLGAGPRAGDGCCRPVGRATGQSRHLAAARRVFLGLASVVFVLVALAAAVVVPLPAQWARIAVRVAGSWIAASGLLMLGWAIRARSRPTRVGFGPSSVIGRWRVHSGSGPS